MLLAYVFFFSVRLREPLPKRTTCFYVLLPSKNVKEEVSKVVFTVQSDSNKVEPGSMSADEFYLIRTQSNEYLVFVDARSEEEYNASHITSSISLVKASA